MFARRALSAGSLVSRTLQGIRSASTQVATAPAAARAGATGRLGMAGVAAASTVVGAYALWETAEAESKSVLDILYSVQERLGNIEAALGIQSINLGINKAFVFIKPHAVTDAEKALVAGELERRGFKVLTEGTITAEDIDSKKLIDQHYYAIASKATILKPAQLNVPKDKFADKFGLTWDDALASGKVLNALDGCAALGVTADEMDALWGAAKNAKKLVKFGGGFYCGLVEVEGKEPHYIFNGFFMSMRSKFTAPGKAIHYYVVEWNAADLSWTDFRNKTLGPTDPADAPADSLRGMTLTDWKALGLEDVPNVGDNGVHASASPFEALAERANWLGASIEQDSFGVALLKAGVDLKTIEAWSVDPQVVINADGTKGSLFDAVEDLDSADCVTKLAELNKLNA